MFLPNFGGLNTSKVALRATFAIRISSHEELISLRFSAISRHKNTLSRGRQVLTILEAAKIRHFYTLQG